MSELCFGYCMCSAKLRKDYTRALKKILYKKILSTRTISVLFSIFASKWTLHTYTAVWKSLSDRDLIDVITNLCGMENDLMKRMPLCSSCHITTGAICC